MDRPFAEKPNRRVACPRCTAPCLFAPENPWRPFCSERCKLIDMGQWASEGYRVPQSEEPAADSDTYPQ